MLEGNLLNSLRQSQRIAAFVLNGALFYCAYAFTNSTWSISGGGETLWLVAAIAWWTLSLLSAPWYRPPRDALAAGIAAAVALLSIDFGQVDTEKQFIILYRDFALGYVGLVIAASLFAAFSDEARKSTLSRAAYDIANRLSSGPLIFGGLAAISIFGFYSELAKVFGLTMLWFFWALIRPIEFIFELWNRTSSLLAQSSANYVGKILRVDDPEIVRDEIDEAAKWRDELHIACLPGGISRYCLPLFYHIQDDSLIGTGLLVGEPMKESEELTGAVVASDDRALRSLLLQQIGGDGAFDLVGFVVEGSSIAEIMFEIAKSAAMVDGSGLFCRVREVTVFYHVM